MRDATPPLKAGDTVAGYEISRLLGSGGHAFVFEVRKPFSDAPLALKLIPSVHKSGRNLTGRGQSEARALHRIRHSNVVCVYDADQTQDGDVYLVMEKLEGSTLREVLRELGRLTVAEVLLLAAQAADGLAAAHAEGIIHRDIKPENLFVTAKNHLKVFDFGVAKVGDWAAHKTTDKRVLQGTLIYMSPEHLQGHSVTVRSDIFALGTVLYEALHQHPATLNPDVTTLQQAAWMQITKVPPILHELDPTIPRYVARFVQRAIAKDPEQRFACMTDMALAARELQERLAADEGVTEAQRNVRNLVRIPVSAPTPDPAADNSATDDSAVRPRGSAKAARPRTGFQPTPLLGSMAGLSSSVIQSGKTDVMVVVDDGIGSDPSASKVRGLAPDRLATNPKNAPESIRYAAGAITTTYDQTLLSEPDATSDPSDPNAVRNGSSALHAPPNERPNTTTDPSDAARPTPQPVSPPLSPDLATQSRRAPPTTHVPIAGRPAGVPAPLLQGTAWKRVALFGAVVGLGFAVGRELTTAASNSAPAQSAPTHRAEPPLSSTLPTPPPTSAAPELAAPTLAALTPAATASAATAEPPTPERPRATRKTPSPKKPEPTPPPSKYQRRLEWLERDLKTAPDDRIPADAPRDQESRRTP